MGKFLSLPIWKRMGKEWKTQKQHWSCSKCPFDEEIQQLSPQQPRAVSQDNGRITGKATQRWSELPPLLQATSLWYVSPPLATLALPEISDPHGQPWARSKWMPRGKSSFRYSLIRPQRCHQDPVFSPCIGSTPLRCALASPYSDDITALAPASHALSLKSSEEKSKHLLPDSLAFLEPRAHCGLENAVW